MKKYKVSQFMVCEAIYEVEAEDPIEAAYKVIFSEGEIQDPRFNLEDLSPALEIGMPEESLAVFVNDQNSHLFDSVRDENGFVTSINYVEEVPPQCPAFNNS